MSVVELIAQGNIHADAQRTDEIMVLVAVVDKTVDDTHLSAALIEIKSDRKRKPVARAIGMEAVCTHDGSDVTAALQTDVGDLALISAEV